MFFKKSPPIQPVPTVTARPTTPQGTTPAFKPQQPSTIGQQPTMVRPVQQGQQPITPTQTQQSAQTVALNQPTIQTNMTQVQNQHNPVSPNPIQKPAETPTLINTTQPAVQAQPTMTAPVQNTLQTLNTTPKSADGTSDTDKYAKPANYKPPVTTETKQDTAKQDAPIMINTR